MLVRTASGLACGLIKADAEVAHSGQIGHWTTSGKPGCRRISRKTLRYSIHSAFFSKVICTSGSIDQSDCASIPLARLQASASADGGSIGISPTTNHPVSTCSSPTQAKSPRRSSTPAKPKTGPQFSGRDCGSLSALPSDSLFSCHNFCDWLIFYTLFQTRLLLRWRQNHPFVMVRSHIIYMRWVPCARKEGVAAIVLKLGFAVFPIPP